MTFFGGNNKYIKYEWKNNNISDMSGIFYNCSSLKSLPDISHWNTINVKNNIGKCSIIYEDKKYELKEFIEPILSILLIS